ncbi:MAG: substrate-binding domain-containing protein [Rhodocyclaceae bacterium]|nr:substrate-binding domain-containing protein [Rhodocyclaceae bacterium]
MPEDETGQQTGRPAGRGRRTFMGVLLAGLLGAASAAGAAEIRVLAANAVRESLTALVGAFEGASGHRVTIDWGGTDAVADRLAGGEACDLVVIAASGIDRLAQGGRLAAGGRWDYARSGIGVAARSGRPRPDVASTEGLRAALLAADRIAVSTGPSGQYMAALFSRLGIAEQVRSRLLRPPSGVQVGELVARGEADLAFQQESELIRVPGIDYLGPLPPEVQHLTVYAIGLDARSTVPEAARALAAALTAAAAAGPIRASGMAPP